MKIKFRKMKIAAVVICGFVAASSFTYVCDHGKTDVFAKTISDLEDEKANNNAEIAKLEEEINGIEDDIANEKYKKELIQDKIDIQTANLDIISTKISELNNRIDDSKKKISELKEDIKTKQKDIDVGKEQFKSRLLAMYVNGNDSLASALVGATDFYDALSKMELISQVSKYDNDLLNSLKTQLEQFEEAKTELDMETEELNTQLSDQETARDEFSEALTALNEEYQKSDSFIDEQEARKKKAQSNIDQYEADNAAMDAEINKINELAAQKAKEYAAKREAAAQQAAASSSSSSSDSSSSGGSSSDDDTGSYSNDDDDNSGSSGGSSGGSYSSSDSVDDDTYYGYSHNTGTEETGSVSGSGSLVWPCAAYGISSEFGPRWGSFHGGIDISNGNTMGASVYAADSGTVMYVYNGCDHNYGKDSSCGCGGGYGNYVMIDHGNGMVTVYGHLSYASVSMGQTVGRGEVIGAAGSTGWSTGAHLHFEVIVNGEKQDPQNYV